MNPILDRLRTETECAFETQQNAFRAMKEAGNERHRINDELSRSWGAVCGLRKQKDQAYDSEQSAWESYKSRRNAISEDIDDAKSHADHLHSQMSDAFQRASDAYNSGNGAAAADYASEGRTYKEALNSANGRVKRLIEKAESIDRPNSNFKRYKNEYDIAIRSHQSIQSRYNAVKQSHESAKAAFQSAKETHTKAKEAFQNAMRQKKEIDRAIVEKAGIKYGYFTGEEAKVVYGAKGDPNRVDIYFGGVNKADGEFHGHIVLDGESVVMMRQPYQDKKDADIDDNRKDHTRI